MAGRGTRNRKAPKQAAGRHRPTRARRPPVTVVPGSLPPKGVLHTVAEPPHAHAVCRVCGRIADVEISGDDQLRLEALAGRMPVDWLVEGITLSLTGSCRRCRQGRVD